MSFAAVLVNEILGGNPDLFPAALVFSLHLPSEHFITLLLDVLKRKLSVYDSLLTTEMTKRTCTKLAKAFALRQDDVEYPAMVQQLERPPTECAIYSIATMSGLRHNTPPQKVSDSP